MQTLDPSEKEQERWRKGTGWRATLLRFLATGQSSHSCAAFSSRNLDSQQKRAFPMCTRPSTKPRPSLVSATLALTLVGVCGTPPTFAGVALNTIVTQSPL
jgi:hypothetical protein